MVANGMAVSLQGDGFALPDREHRDTGNQSRMLNFRSDDEMIADLRAFFSSKATVPNKSQGYGGWNFTTRKTSWVPLVNIEEPVLLPHERKVVSQRLKNINDPELPSITDKKELLVILPV